MPNIRQYENPINGLQPDDRAANAFAFAGRSIAGSYEDLGRSLGGIVKDVGGAYVEHETRQDIAAAAAKLPVIQQFLAQDLNKRMASADPSDDTVGDQYLQESLTPTLSEFRDSMKTEAGRQWADQQIAQVRQHGYEQASAAMASRAGAQMHQNLTTLNNQATNLVASDPSALTTQLGLVDNSYNAILDNSKDLTPAQQAATRDDVQSLKSNLVVAAISGAIEQNPTAAKAIIATGRFAGTDISQYLDAGKIEQLNAHADTVLEHMNAQQRANEAALKAQQKEQVSAAASQLSVQLFQPDGTLSMPQDFYQNLRTLASMPGADAGEIRALENMAKGAVEDAAKGKPVITDPHTYADFASRVTLPATDPRVLTDKEIYDARFSGHLSNEDMSNFLRAADDIKKDPTLGQARSEIDRVTAGFKSSITESNPYLGMVSPAQDQLYLQFQQEANGRFAILMRDGKSATEAAQILTDPRNPQYIGNMAQRYAMSKEAAQRLLHQSFNGGVGLLPSRAPNAQAGVGTLQGQPGVGSVPPVATTPAAPAAVAPPDFPKARPGESIPQLQARIAAWRLQHAGQ